MKKKMKMMAMEGCLPGDKPQERDAAAMSITPIPLNYTASPGV